MGISGWCSACSLLRDCAGARRERLDAVAAFHTSQHSHNRRLERRNAAPRTPARAAARHTYGKAATTLCSTHDAIDATARMQQHDKPRAPTTTRTNARIFVRARASASPRRRRAQTKEPAHAALWLRSGDLHARIVLRVRTALQGVLPGDGFWGHDEKGREGHFRSTKAGGNFKSHQGDL